MHHPEPDLSDYTPAPDLARAHTLPARWYLDPAFLDLERARVFARTWQPVGRREQALRPGDYFTAEIQGEPLVVTRGPNDTLRAFANVCRHRAGPVARGQGNRKTLQCQYHGWTYDLEGRLLKAPEFEGVADWAPEEVCLPAVSVAEWGPFIFANLDPAAPALLEVLGDIPAEVAAAGFDIASMGLIERREYEIHCNWKVYIDNYLEGYHILIAHPGLYRALDYDQYRVETHAHYSKQHAPMRPKPEQPAAHHPDRRLLRGEAEEQALYYWVFPNVMLNFYPDNLQLNIILPLDHQRTLTLFEWYFHQPGSGEGWESMQQSIAFSDQVQQEDIEICEAVQRGLRSASYNQGRFSFLRENGVHHFQTLLHRYLTT